MIPGHVAELGPKSDCLQLGGDEVMSRAGTSHPVNRLYVHVPK